jgi:hypothetical protein
MWLKYLFITIIFFILALLQASFFSYFSILGVTLNFVFILFFLILFFCRKDKIFKIFTAITAGFFLDVFSISIFASCIVSFLIINFVAEKLFSNLKETDEKLPIFSFLLFFLLFFIFNELFLDLIIYFSSRLLSSNLGWVFLIQLVYNLLFAIIGFYVFKKLQNKK